MDKVKWAIMLDSYIVLQLSQVHKFELFDMGFDYD